MKILAIDTCTNCCSATILDDGVVLGHNFINTKITHSETVIKLVDDILSSVRLDINDIDVFATSSGPGSFTGVRISSSIIKGFCFKTEKKCINISSLLSLAYNLIDVNGVIMPVLDARRNQFYTALFCCNNKTIKRMADDTTVDIDKVSNFIKGINKTVFLTGDGAKKCYEYLSHQCDNVVLVSEVLLHNSSFGVALASFNNLCLLEDSKNITPNYIRLSQAEKDLKEKNNKNI